MSERQSESSSDASRRSVSAEESSSDEDFGTVDMNPYGGEPYQDEPLAIAGQEATLNFKEDKDGIPAETLESRYIETQFYVFGRCSCNFSQDELLIGALEYRCCREVICAIGKSIFDGSIERITCIIQHEDYIAMSNEAVLSIGWTITARQRWMVI